MSSGMWISTGFLPGWLLRRAGVEHAVSVTSGTAALHVAYAAAGIERPAPAPQPTMPGAHPPQP